MGGSLTVVWQWLTTLRRSVRILPVTTIRPLLQALTVAGRRRDSGPGVYLQTHGCHGLLQFCNIRHHRQLISKTAVVPVHLSSLFLNALVDGASTIFWGNLFHYWWLLSERSSNCCTASWLKQFQWMSSESAGDTSQLKKSAAVNIFFPVSILNVSTQSPPIHGVDT